MKPFESCLADHLEEYLTFRRGLGYSDRGQRSPLRSFDRFLFGGKEDWEVFTPAFFLDFQQSLTQSPRTVNQIVSAVHGFFQFQRRRSRILDNPLAHLGALPQGAYIPFVFSPRQVHDLLQAVEDQIRQSQRYFLYDLGVSVALGLIAHLGLRISEPLRLKLCDYRPKEATVYIEKTKFKKDRLLPIPRSVKGSLDNYLNVRRALFNKDHEPFLLAGLRGQGLKKKYIYKAFHQALKDCGLNEPRRRIANTTFSAPVVHSFRHSFAINTLKRIKSQGKSPQHALPVLAAYLGHRNYRHTAVYLKLLDAEQRHALVDFVMERHREP